MNAPSLTELMSKKVLGVGADWPVEQLADFFVEHQISGAPVLNEDGELAGVVSLMDIVRHDSIPVRELDSAASSAYYQGGLEGRLAYEEVSAFRMDVDSTTTVRDIMTPMIFEVSEKATIQHVADMMIKGGIHRLFVTRDRKIVGIITALDMLRVVRDL